MKTIVITGSIRGIGFGMAENFLARGWNVVISGRKNVDVDEKVNLLKSIYDSKQLFGQACDVSKFDEVKNLWVESINKFNQVDIWVNNAGIAKAMMPFWENDPIAIEQVVSTNMVGTMFGSKVAIEGMLSQGHGSIFNMEGAGSTGRMHPKMILYASTKRGLNYLNLGLIKELENTPIKLGILRPGMVLTDFLLNARDRNPEEWERTKKIFNILADTPENVCPAMVEGILKANKHGEVIEYISGFKIMMRFMTAKFSKRNLFED